MNKKQVTALAISLGLSKKAAEKMAEHADDKAADVEQKEIDEIVTDFKANQTDVFKNDPDFLKEVIGPEKGKIMDMNTRAIKSAFGLEAGEIKDKTYEEVLKIAKDKANAGATAPVKDLQEQLMAANNKIKNFEEVVLPGKDKEKMQFEKNIKKSIKLREELGKFKLRVAADPVFSSIDREINSAFDVDLDDSEKLVLKTKGADTFALNKDKTGKLTVNEFMSSKLTEWDFIQKSNAKDDKTKKDIDPLKDEGKNKVEKPATYSPHIEAAMKNLENLKKDPAKKD